ncbi:tetratricopeptide repeat protein [Pseudoalteromonas pernae]|uniref:tetratricopeptide repeat protein n=1 Tax=Pseudoalteromonas pernae TaxID=3118054 RepID=UPI003242C207
MRFLLTSCVLLASVLGAAKAAEPIEAVQLYTQDELVKLIRKNAHLKRVKDDDCQLVQDIAARASKMELPAYQFLYGDMLAYNVCVERDVELGVYYMRQAAEQGLAEALEQLGRYYDTGKLVQADKAMAIIYLREAAAQGSLPAQLRLVKLYNSGYGSPQDYEDAYRWLFHSTVVDTAMHKQISSQLATLAKKMPDSVVARARLPMDN